MAAVQTTGRCIVQELKQWPPCRPLDDVPCRHEVEEAIRALANRKAAGADGLPAELLKVLVDKGELDTLGKFHDIIIALWRGDGVQQQPWRAAKIMVQLQRKETGEKMGTSRAGKVERRGGKEEEEVQRLWGMLYADDTGIVSRSSEGLERMKTVIVTACSAFRLTVSEPET